MRRRLTRALTPVLRRSAARRIASWLSVSILLFWIGSGIAAAIGLGRGDATWIRAGLLLASFSALPAFLLWPLPAGLVLSRLREIDDDTVIEAYLEAPPGEAREILGRMAILRAAALEDLPTKRKRPRLFAGLWPLFAAALAAIVLVELGSIALRRRPLVFGSGADDALGAPRREAEFSDFLEEDPASRLARAAAARREGADPGSGSAAAGEAAGALPSGLDAARRSRRGPDDIEPAAGQGGGAAPEGGTVSEAGSRPGGDVVPGDAGATASLPERAGAEALPGSRAGRAGKGYDSSGRILAESPLVDYRARFAAAYAERTGTHIGAGGELAQGELRSYERRYFRSFALSSGLGPTEDAYASLLRERWKGLKGGIPE